jgi:hypothetical protein
MKRHRILIASGVGLLFGLLCLLQAAGVFYWIPETVFFPLHAPALFLAGLFIHGEQVLMLVPVTIVVQWIIVGALAGLIWHLVHGSKPTA